MSPTPRRLLHYAKRLTPWEMRYVLRGEKRHKAGDRVKAHNDYAKVLARNPKCWPAVFNLAVLAHEVCEHDVAITHLRRMTQHEPGAVDAWYNLGTILQSVGQYEEAERCLRRAVELAPDWPSPRVNLGNALLGLGRREEADAQYRAAMAHEPQNAEALWNRAHYLILTGRWLEGWHAYEARWGLPGFTELNAIRVDADRADLPREWTGQPLAGCRLIVVGEQGWGDDIMCLRYAAALRDRGATTIWALRKGLHRLARTAVAPDEVVDVSEPVPPADYITTTMSLHHYLRVTPETVPLSAGYLKAAA